MLAGCPCHRSPSLAVKASAPSFPNAGAAIRDLAGAASARWEGRDEKGAVLRLLRGRELAAARGWAAWALRIAEEWPLGIARTEAMSDLHHRLERVERKLTGKAITDDPEIEVDSATATTD